MEFINWKRSTSRNWKTKTHLRPDVEGFVVPGKDAEDYILQRPLAAVIVQYVLVVLHILWKVLELHQHLLLLIILIIPTLLLLSTTALPRPRLRFFPVIAHLAGKHLVLRQIWTVRLRTSSLSLSLPPSKFFTRGLPAGYYLYATTTTCGANSFKYSSPSEAARTCQLLVGLKSKRSKRSNKMKWGRLQVIATRMTLCLPGIYSVQTFKFGGRWET